jgi:hypothetical protein
VREDVHAQELRGKWPQRAAQRMADGLERHRLVQVPLGGPPVEVADGGVAKGITCIG